MDECQIFIAVASLVRTQNQKQVATAIISENRHFHRQMKTKAFQIMDVDEFVRFLGTDIR